MIESYTNNETLRNELKNHLAIRKKNGNLTNRSIELGFQNLDRLTKDYPSEEAKNNVKIEIVRQSIEKGWGGYFPLKKTSSNKEKIENEKNVPKDLDTLYDNG